MSERDFYTIPHEGRSLRLPRVTSILKIIDKSNPLMAWATRLEREALKAAIEETLTLPGPQLTPQALWERLQAVLGGKRAWVKARDRAADIGTAAHDLIRWHTQRLMGVDAGPEPTGPDEAQHAVQSWLQWSREVQFQPLYAERLVYCPKCAYAGTIDTLGLVAGKMLVVDYKTGKAVYDEAHLQVRAYRHAAAREGLTTDGGMIVRLPKTPSDPKFEAVPAVDIPYKYWLYVSGAWRWQRIMEQDDIGSQDMRRCDVAE